MQAISININDKNIEHIDIQMQANTVYSFFNSILIDEVTSLKDHTIHTDANALEENKTAFFLGEQLLLGNALITGTSSDADIDTNIPLETLEKLISYNIPEFYTNTFKILSQTDINLYRLFSVDKDDKKIELNIEWVLATFNIADERTKEYFLTELTKSLESKTTQEVLEKMAQLAINVA